MRLTIMSLGVVALAAATVGCINREGTFEGEYTVTSKLTKDGKELPAGAPKRITVAMKSPSKGKLSADVDGCTLSFSDRAVPARPSPPDSRAQRCKLRYDTR